MYHTFIVLYETNHDKVFNNEVKRLKFCKRKLIEDLEDDEKIFVIKTSSPQGARIEHVADIAKVISEYGPGMILWVNRSDDHNPSGTIKWHTANLLEGRIDRLCEPGYATFHSPYWIPLCRRAYKAIEIRKLGLLTLPPLSN